MDCYICGNSMGTEAEVILDFHMTQDPSYRVDPLDFSHQECEFWNDEIRWVGEFGSEVDFVDPLYD